MRPGDLFDYFGAKTRTESREQRFLREQSRNKISPEVTYEQVTSNQNDYPLMPGDFHRIFTDASRTITGFANVWPGRFVVVANVGGSDLVIAHDNAGSSVPHRVIVHTAANLTLNLRESVILVYDGQSQRWRVIATTGA